MSKNNDYTTGNLLDYEYFPKNHRSIAEDLNKQIELENADLKQQINFIVDLKKMQQCCSLLRKKKKLILIFHKILSLLFDIYKNGNSKDCKFIK